MRDDKPAHVECDAMAASLLQCLRMLADEADNQRLARTHLALRKAIRACQAEQVRRVPLPSRPRRSMLTLH